MLGSCRSAGVRGFGLGLLVCYCSASSWQKSAFQTYTQSLRGLRPLVHVQAWAAVFGESPSTSLVLTSSTVCSCEKQARLRPLPGLDTHNHTRTLPETGPKP